MIGRVGEMGYHVGKRFMTQTAEGTYPSIHDTSAPMGDAAQAYLIGFNDHWRRTANTWICVEGVLVC
jgi:hypothetical protein